MTPDNDLFQSDLTLAVQAGGTSSRMGRDKALLPFGGMALIQYMIGRGSVLTGDIIVTSNRSTGYDFLGIPICADAQPGQGALAGLRTALSAARRPFVAVIACDMPFFSPLLLAEMTGLLRRSEAAAVVPRTDRGWEPFHAVYRREVCLQAVEAVLAAGVRSLHGWLDGFRFAELDAEIIRRRDPKGYAFTNINTEADYQAALALLGKIHP